MQFAGILVWWLLISALGLVATPLALKAFKFLPDRGYAFTKPLGLLLVGLLAWLIGFIHFSIPTILLSAGLLAAGAYWVWKRFESELRIFLKEHLGYILVTEMFFFVLFLLFLAFRMYNPDILGTEKFMDMAFLHSLTRAESFPPYDPWLSGQGFYISYYYFGYLLMAILLKLSGVAPAVGFNLSLGMLFALSGVTVFGLLYNLTRRLWAGLAGWCGIFLLGSLDGLRQVLGTRTLANFNWWTPSRVIPDTINEFPFFSFLLGDMHPHMLDIPYFVLSLALGLNHLRSEDDDVSPRAPERLAGYALWGLVIGALGFINSWDLPTGFFIAMLAFAGQQYRRRGSWAALPWRDMLAGLGVILGFAVVPYLPFYLNFHSQAKGLAVTTQNTRSFDYFLIFGTFVFLTLTFLMARYHAWFVALLSPARPAGKPAEKKSAVCPNCGIKVREGKRFCGQCGRAMEPESPAEDSPLARPLEEVPAGLKRFWLFLLQPAAVLRRGEGRGPALLVLGGLLLIALAAFFKSPFLAATVLLLLALLPLLSARADRPETAFALMLLFTAWLLTFGAEVLHINDTFQPPLDRMNTVFKFYYQVWFLLGIGGLYGAYWMLRHSLRTPAWRAAWLTPLALLVAGSLVYSYAGMQIKANYFANWPTLDGSAFLRAGYPSDHEGIEWLRTHAQGAPVVLEATGGEYTDFARVSTFTGLPTVLGWAGHELQWRGNYDEPSRRIPDIDTLYGSPDVGRTQELLDQYGVEYVFVGTLERGKYPEASLQKFAAFMEPVFRNDGVVIYRRKSL